MERPQETRMDGVSQDTKGAAGGGPAARSHSGANKRTHRSANKHAYDTGTPLGLASTSVRIVEYDPYWALLFDQEKACILDAIGTQVLDIEHVGSTSVPGLPAKPIIDVAVAIADLDNVKSLIVPLQALNYQQRPEIQIPGEVFFRRTDGSYHLHVVEHGSTWWRDYLRFRNHLRKHPDIAAHYLNLKNNLAAQYAEDRPAYTKGKASFIQEILDSITEV